MRGDLKKVDPGDGSKQLVLNAAKNGEEPALSQTM